MATLLVITVVLPFLGSLVLLVLPKLEFQRARSIALATALVTLGFSLIVLWAFDPESSGPQFAFVRGSHLGLEWLGRPDIRFSLGLDGLSLWLFLLTSILMITSIAASWTSITENPGPYYAFLLALETGLLGLFSSLDIVLFYIFFEFTLIPLFFLIGLWGGPRRKKAAVTFFLYTLAGSLLTLLGVISLVIVHYQHSPGNVLTFSIPELTSGLAALSWPAWKSAAAWGSPQVVIFLLLLAGFAIKVPLFPFHTWLPLAHVEAPTAGSILLAGVLLKVGTYGLVRFNLGMTPLASASLFPLLATMSVAGIIYGALAALSQTDIKRLVAYSSVSHMGFIVLGIFSLNATALDGASIQMLNHGLTTGALFACVGMIYERYHTRDMNAIGGLWIRLPILAFFLILATLGSAAVPGLNGFVGEFPILLGAFANSPRSGVLAATGMVLGACYLFWMMRKVLFGPLLEPVPHAAAGEAIAVHALSHTAIPPIGRHEIAGLAPLMFLIVAIGLYPKPVLEQMRPTLAKIDQNTQAVRAGEIHAVPATGVKTAAGDAPSSSAADTERLAQAQQHAKPAQHENERGKPATGKTGRAVENADSTQSPGTHTPRTNARETHT